MYAPSFACKSLYGLHKQLRLAWCGPKKCFSVVQLYHIRDVGDIDDPEYCYRELWNVGTRETQPGCYERVKVDRGAIFNRYGSTQLDYDPFTRVPVWVATLNSDYSYPDGEPIKHPEDVFSGKFMLAMEAWLLPIKERLRIARFKHSRDVISRAEDIGAAITDDVWNLGKAGTSTTNHMLPYKFNKKQIAKNDYFVQTRQERLAKYWALPK